MRVVCINNGGYHLTVNKIYDVSSMLDETVSMWFDYMVTNDNGYYHAVEASLFVSLSEVRLKRLELIGI